MKRPAILLALVVSLFLSGPAAAQPADELRALRQELDALKQEQVKLRGEVQALREQVQRGRRAAAPSPPPAESVSLSPGNESAKGDKNAKLVLVEFTDYQ